MVLPVHHAKMMKSYITFEFRFKKSNESCWDKISEFLYTSLALVVFVLLNKGTTFQQKNPSYWIIISAAFRYTHNSKVIFSYIIQKWIEAMTEKISLAGWYF